MFEYHFLLHLDYKQLLYKLFYHIPSNQAMQYHQSYMYWFWFDLKYIMYHKLLFQYLLHQHYRLEQHSYKYFHMLYRMWW